LKTFLDSGVLLTAWRGALAPHTEAALAVMADDRRQFFTADNVKLELLPRPTFERRRLELEFYQAHFDSAVHSEPFSEKLGATALALAGKYGLAAGDALNLASAIRQGVEEFVTSELPGKPMFRVTEVLVTSIHSAQAQPPLPG